MILAIAAVFALRPGDIVVFYGDSITQQQLYTVYVEDFVRTRYPNLQVKFYNRGWSGDTSWGGGGGSAEQRVDRDVKPLNPTVVTVMLGMNDGGYVPYEAKIFNVFDDSYGKLLGFIHRDAPKARLTLIQTSPWDDFAHTHAAYDSGSWHPWQGYNDTLLQYGEVVQAWARKDSDEFVDFNKPVADMLKSSAKQDSAEASQIVADSIHPGPAGHLIMAGALLEQWGASPTVADVELNAETKAVERSTNSKVGNFDGLSWSEQDEALPFCVNPGDKTIQLALQNSDFQTKLNMERLAVSGLPEGNYSLSIDGKTVTTIGAKHLADGINLADYDTPMRAQALEVLDWTQKRSALDFTAWREIGIDLAGQRYTQATLGDLNRLEDELQADEVHAAQPKTHKFELKKLD